MIDVMQIKRIFFQIVILLAVFFVVPQLKNVFAAALKFDPAAVTTTAGQTFEVAVKIDALSTDQYLGVDAVITYDQTVLEPQGVTNGTIFTTVTNPTMTGGTVYVVGLVDDVATSKSGSGTLATVVFKALKNGTANLSFTCGPATGSHITKNDLNGTDLILCASNGTSAVTVGAGNTSNPTATPTLASSSNTYATAAPTAVSQLPRSGITENNLPIFIAAGTLLFLIGIGFKLL
ncbi:MAG: hypothetical protein HYW86_05080 [Candidatus Roizmanbacteria bacterium]|nr:MAG: hypothetical protein HYW86_05080 [Candidatus Roizmanbacteria bacterium]